MKESRSSVAIAVVVLCTSLVGPAHAFYSPETGRWLNRDRVGENVSPPLYCFVRNETIGEVDVLGLLDAEVVSIKYMGHGSCEKGFPAQKYLSLDERISGQVPLDLPGSKKGTAIHFLLDGTFSAVILASTSAAELSPSQDLRMSTFLQGDIKVRCPCPFGRAQAGWRITASVTTGALPAFPKAQAIFERQQVNASPRNPNASLSGVSFASLDSSYLAMFHFDVSQAWTDAAPSSRSIASKVTASVHFTCVP